MQDNTAGIVEEPRKVLWIETLRNVLYTHESDVVEFNIQDIEDLCKYVEQLDANNSKLEIKMTRLSNKIDNLNCQLLAEVLKPIKTEKLNKFSVYA